MGQKPKRLQGPTRAGLRPPGGPCGPRALTGALWVAQKSVFGVLPCVPACAGGCAGACRALVRCTAVPGLCQPRNRSRPNPYRPHHYCGAGSLRIYSRQRERRPALLPAYSPDECRQTCPASEKPSSRLATSCWVYSDETVRAQGTTRETDPPGVGGPPGPRSGARGAFGVKRPSAGSRS